MTYPQIDPVIFSIGPFFDIGPLQVRWYGLMYVIGFLISGYLLKVLIKKKFFKVTEDKVDTLITTMIICMFLGARLTYVFIYNWDYYSQHLSELLSVWQGGLSFHGALIGLLVGGVIFARQNKIPWLQVMDAVALAGTQGLFFGRLGNFINGELYGRTTTHWLGMIFPNGGPYPRHPSQLYEAFLEGILLSAILWIVLSRTKIYGIIGTIFLFGYGFFRFIVEYFREPDQQLGFFLGGSVTMGQILCFLMMIGSIGIFVMAKKQNSKV